jgi:hypothetical protein
MTTYRSRRLDPVAVFVAGVVLVLTSVGVLIVVAVS